MPRASRYYTPGLIRHITHRCHKKEFLLKFKRDRELGLYWLFEAKKHFGFIILNYIDTSNHIHLLKRLCSMLFMMFSSINLRHWRVLRSTVAHPVFCRIAASFNRLIGRVKYEFPWGTAGTRN